MMAGQYRSVFRGTGIEFEEVREYSPGDEVKSIDWKVSARLGRPFVKLYREERELIVMLLVDMSASGLFGTGTALKREIAAETAAILAFNAIKNNDKVGVVLFTDTVEKYIPPKKGSSHVWRVIREIFSFRPDGEETDIPEAMSYFSRVSRKKSVCFLISDFLSPSLPSHTRLLRIAAKKHEFIAVLLSDPADFSLPSAGMLYAQDLETGERIEFDAFDRKTQDRFRRYQTAQYQRLLDTIKAAEMDCIEMGTSDDAADVLTRYFRYREMRKR